MGAVMHGEINAQRWEGIGRSTSAEYRVPSRGLSSIIANAGGKESKS